MSDSTKKGEKFALSDSIKALVEPEEIIRPVPDPSRPFDIIPKPHYGDALTPLDWSRIKELLDNWKGYDPIHTPIDRDEDENIFKPYLQSPVATQTLTEAIEELGLYDFIDTDTTRGLPDSSTDEDTPIDPSAITPLTPLIVTGNNVSEALRAKDEIRTDLVERKDMPLIIQPRPYNIIIDSGKKHYLDLTGRVMHPCEVLDNENFSIYRRKHVKTGNSKARVRQIRRHYAALNCR